MSQRFGAHGEEVSTPRWRPLVAVFLAIILHLALFSMVPSCDEKEEKKTEISLRVEEPAPPEGVYAGTPEEVVTGMTEIAEPEEDFFDRSLPPSPVPPTLPAPRGKSEPAPQDEWTPPAAEPVVSGDQVPASSPGPTPPYSRGAGSEIPQEPETEESEEKKRLKKLVEEMTEKGFYLQEEKTPAQEWEEPPDIGHTDPFGQPEDPIGFGHAPAPANEPMGTGAEGGGRIMGGSTFDFWSGDEHTAEIGRARSEFERDWAEFQKWKHTDLGHGVICNTDGEWFICGEKTIERCNRAHGNMCRYARKKEREFLSDATIF